MSQPMSLLDFIADNVEPGPSIRTRPAPVSLPEFPAPVAGQPIQTPPESTPDNSIFSTAPGGEPADKIPAWSADPSHTAPASVPRLGAREVATLDGEALYVRLVAVADRRVILESAGVSIDAPELRHLKAEMRWACEHRPAVFDRLMIPYPVAQRPTVADDDVLIIREVF
jgi:hypothetical protein